MCKCILVGDTPILSRCTWLLITSLINTFFIAIVLKRLTAVGRFTAYLLSIKSSLAVSSLLQLKQFKKKCDNDKSG